MSCTLNGEQIVVRQARPRNYSDQVVMSRELRKELDHQMFNVIKDKEYDEWDEKRREKNGKDQYFMCDFGRAEARFGS